MQAFHNDPKVKQFYVDRLAEHHRLNQIIQGTRWSQVNNNGCIVGCILHSYDHDLYPDKLGLPVWYAYLCDKIFEGLPKDKAPAFAMSTLTAIKPGVDIESVKWKLAIIRHNNSLKLLSDNKEPYADQCRSAIQSVIDYCEGMLNNSFVSARSAQSAAWSAEWSAHYGIEAETLIRLLTEL